MRHFSAIWQELGPTCKLAIPLALTQLISVSLQFTDIIMAGHYSAVTLAGVSVAGQLFAIVFLLMIGIGISMSARISWATGKESNHLIRRNFQQGLWVYLFMALIMMIATFGCAYVPELIGTVPEVAAEAKKYLLVLAIPSGFLVISQCFRYLFEGMSHPRINIFVQLALIPINAAGNWLSLNYTNLGAQGMAISTGICIITYCIVMGSVVFHGKKWRKLRLLYPLSPPNWKLMRELIMLGTPIGIAVMLEVSLFSVVGILVSRENPIITSANQIAVNYSSTIFMIPLGIASALTIRCANALGRNDWKAIANIAYGGLLLCSMIMALSMMILLLFAKDIAAIYSQNPEIISITASLLTLFCISELFDGIQIAAAGVLRGIGDTKITLIYAILSYWIIGFTLGLILAYPFKLGIYGLWIGCITALFVYAVLALNRVRWHFKYHLSKNPS